MSRTTRTILRPGLLLPVAVLGMLLIAPSASAQDPNICDEPGESPDVIVGDLPEVQRQGSIGGITAYSLATTSCNVGTCWLNWISNTNEHPVIGQNLFRYKDGRFEQIGQSWLKHGFFALSQNLCSDDCVSTNGTHLGVNCSDPYDASTNANQARLGPKSDVNPVTGAYSYPFPTQGVTGDDIFKRLQVHNTDLDPTLNPDVRYFVEGQYVTADDASAGNSANNNSYSEAQVNDLGNEIYELQLVGQAFPSRPAVQAWKDADSGVTLTEYAVTGDGVFLVASKATDAGGGMWHYEYAVHNLTSHRSAMSVAVPILPGAVVANTGFHDVDYHSGEPYDLTDWPATVNSIENPGAVFWSTDSEGVNPNANALRWGTLYNFRFDADAAPRNGAVTLGLFRPGSPAAVTIDAVVPGDCNGNGFCDPGEDCNNCISDCPSQSGGTPFCGDGSCQPSAGEDCQSCAQDCNVGMTFCCGDNVDCSDPRCSFPGFTCGIVAQPFCCGDDVCDPGEDDCSCASDCGLPPSIEAQCNDGTDEDCDGQIDCMDTDCCDDLFCDDLVDGDSDGVAGCDCDDGNDMVWRTPGEAVDLVIPGDGPAGTEFEWTSPLEPGAMSHGYEMLRSTGAGNFSGAVCLSLADPQDPMAVDQQIPVVGQVFHYLVRATNACPDESGQGSLGLPTTGGTRLAGGCP